MNEQRRKEGTTEEITIKVHKKENGGMGEKCSK
jgi:hypothetical protein